MENKDVATVLIEFGLSSLRSIAHEPGENGGQYFAFVTVVRNRKNRQKPSNQELETIRTKASMEGINVVFLLQIDGTTDIEANVRATLTANFEPFVRSAYSSFNNKKVYVWVDQKKEIPAAALVHMSRAAKEIFKPTGHILEAVVPLRGSAIPSKLALLSQIRKLAPATAEVVAEALKKIDFQIPSPDWLNHQLDKLRKNGEIVRGKSGRYSLSAKALGFLGTRKDRRSPDIIRLLALARSEN